MYLTRQRIVALLTLAFMAQMLLGCAGSMSTVNPEFSSTPGYATPAPGTIGSPNPAYADAQATMDTGQSQLLDLSRKATEANLNISQAANAVAQATQEYSQRQQVELDYQATVISLNIAQAAATQKFIRQQTKMAEEATAAALSSAAAATHSAYLVHVTQTAQAQAILDFQASQTAQAVAALTTYPLTATPLAVTQAALLMQEYWREQQSFIDRVVSPSLPIVASTFALLLLILIIVLARRRFMPVSWPPRLRIARVNVNPLNMIDGVIKDHDLPLHRIIPSELTPANPPGLPGENTVHVEIVNATEPPFAHWIAEVEHQLTTKGGL
jgi:hypothetical protein